MRRLILSIVVAALMMIPANGRADDTPEAAKTRKILKEKKIDVDWNEDNLEFIKSELAEKLPGVKFHLDGKGGVSRNSKLTYKAKGQTAEQVLSELCKKGGDLGWFIISGNKAYNGQVMISKGGERGYEKGKEPK